MIIDKKVQWNNENLFMIVIKYLEMNQISALNTQKGLISYLPNPSAWQDMTQGQIFKQSLFRVFLLLD